MSRFRKKFSGGKAFPEGVNLFIKRKSRLGKEDLREASLWQEGFLSKRLGLRNGFLQKQVFLLFPVFVFCFLILFFRLFSLQVVRGEENLKRSQENRVRLLTVHAPRGSIFDRNGRTLAKNTPGFRMTQDTEKGKVSRFLDYDKALSLETKDVLLEIDSIRSYPEGEVFAHVLGYTSEISRDELSLPEFFNYKIGDRVGRAGVEETFEKYLRGRDGREIVEIDASGHQLQVLGKEEPKSGLGLYLTIDGDLQKVMYSSLKVGLEKARSQAGVAIAQDPNNGQVLGLVSLPSFDPNLFTKERQGLAGLFANPFSPLLNRATAGLYPPGSVFKIVTSAAGLLTGKIDENTKFEDTGILYLGPYSFANWYFTSYGKKEGFLNLVKAIKRSNDIFFYKVGRLVGEEKLAEFARLFGLGEKTGVDLPTEEAGLVPTPSWKEEKIGLPWYPGDTLHMAIGQGSILTTPLQVSNMVCAVANGGTLFRPFLGKKAEGEGKSFQFQPQVIRENLIGERSLELIREGMRQACLPGGTGWPFFDFKPEVGCKTGTAEFGDPGGKTHAWFTVFAPFENPEIVVTVLVEGGGEGSSVAAPIAKEILKYWFGRG